MVYLTEYVEENKYLGPLREILVRYIKNEGTNGLPVKDEECAEVLSNAVDAFFFNKKDIQATSAKDDKTAFVKEIRLEALINLLINENLITRGQLIDEEFDINSANKIKPPKQKNPIKCLIAETCDIRDCDRHQVEQATMVINIGDYITVLKHPIVLRGIYTLSHLKEILRCVNKI